MNVLLVEPPFHSFLNYDRWYYPTSLAQLAATVSQNNHEVQVYDADRYHYKDPATKNRNVLIERQHLYFENIDNFDHPIWQHYQKVLEELKPDVVGVSVFTCKLKSALNILELTRKYNKKIKTCVGGAHVTAIPQSLLSNKNIDAVFTGYADVSFPNWLNEGCPSGRIHGDMNKINYSSLPYPFRQSILFKEHFTPRDWGYMFSSRGCVGRCTFCSNSFLWSGKTKFRTSDSLRKEIAELIDHWGVNFISLGDSSNSDAHSENKRVASILKEFEIPWTSNVRWATVSKELLEHFMDCGCTNISVGLEAGSERMLKYMNKGCKKETIRQKAKMMNSLGINWQLFTIVGFPEETESEMLETRDFVLEINPTSVSLNSLSPLPGTSVYNELPSITEEIAASVNQLHPNMCFSKYVDFEKFNSIFKNITETFEKHNEKQRAIII